MKKFLRNYDFENYYDSLILSRGKNYYKENRILDIWYQQDLVTAYIDGSEIYKIEIREKKTIFQNQKFQMKSK